MEATTRLLDDATVVQRIFDHIDNKTTDLGDDAPGASRSRTIAREARFAAERDAGPAPLPVGVLPVGGAARRRAPTSRATPPARRSSPCAADDGQVRAFRNACRHRGTQLVGGRGLREGVRLPLPRLDLRPRRAPPPRAARARLPRPRQEHARTRAGRDRRERQRRRLRHAGRRRAARRVRWTDLPPLIPPSYRLARQQASSTFPANWKIVVEGFLEGYHIRSTHARDVLSRSSSTT